MEPHAVLLVDEKGIVTKANQAARDLFGECVGRACRDVVKVRDPLHRTGCQGTCAQQLALHDEVTRAAVGAVAGKPHRVSCAGMDGQVVVTITATGEIPDAPEPLTPREREILGLVTEGLSGTRIARRLGISPATVRTHVEHVRDKLGARTRAEAVARATALGLL